MLARINTLVVALKDIAFRFEVSVSAVGWDYPSDPAVAGASGACKILEQKVGEIHALVSKDHGVDLVLAHVTTSKDAGTSDGVSAAGAFSACLRTDRPDGMYATVVCDMLGVAIGLVYSNDESIAYSVATGDATYWSRSRNSLWTKGKTSGATQVLDSIRFDCDADALKFTVEQRGTPPSFCHRGCRTCWGEDNGIGHLFRTIQDRKANAPEGSYTKRLFNDMALLRDKLLEESQEVMEAVADVKAGNEAEGGSQHVAEETADLLYFALVACSAGDATLSGAIDVLAGRSLKVRRRPGNAKLFRQKAAERALEALGKNSK